MEALDFDCGRWKTAAKFKITEDILIDDQEMRQLDNQCNHVMATWSLPKLLDAVPDMKTISFQLTDIDNLGLHVTIK